jgi:hypothetical protein
MPWKSLQWYIVIPHILLHPLLASERNLIFPWGSWDDCFREWLTTWYHPVFRIMVSFEPTGNEPALSFGCLRQYRPICVSIPPSTSSDVTDIIWNTFTLPVVAEFLAFRFPARCQAMTFKAMSNFQTFQRQGDVAWRIKWMLVRLSFGTDSCALKFPQHWWFEKLDCCTVISACISPRNPLGSVPCNPWFNGKLSWKSAAH